MLRRQDSLLSSSHLETPSPTENRRHAKPIGCLSAIFRLISKYQNRKKLLTFGKKSPKSAVSTQTDLQESMDSPTLIKEDNHDLKKHVQDLESKRLTRDVTPRSPVLRPEIRLPNDVCLPENAKTPRALVARLMGLEEEPNLQPKNQPAMPEKELISNTEEKRRRLLQALEKCNEDLESLKKIIMAVQLGDEHNQQSARVRPSEIFKPRPISGTDDDEILCSTWSRNNYTKLNSKVFMPQQRKKHLGKKPGGEDGVGIGLFNKVQAESLKMKRKACTTPNFWSNSSKAMIQSVDEVCNDILCGEKREQRNLELALDNYISKDLIEEVIFDLGFNRKQKLPFDACRKRISF